MRLDHIAYRTSDREAAVKFFKEFLGYVVSPQLKEGFDIQFEDGSEAKCYVLEPPEANSTGKGSFAYGYFGNEWHSPPEIFVSDGTENSIVSKWVEKNGSGIHHLAYEVESVESTMSTWKSRGIKFTTNSPLKCEGVIQAFTEENPITGIIYEIIERETRGFCRDNVKKLMKSTDKQ